MPNLDKILAFEKMISPLLLQVLFWAGMGGVICGTHLLVKLDHWAWWMPLLFGSLLTRVIFERAMLSFPTHARLVEIATSLRDLESVKNW